MSDHLTDDLIRRSREARAKAAAACAVAKDMRQKASRERGVYAAVRAGWTEWQPDPDQHQPMHRGEC